MLKGQSIKGLSVLFEKDRTEIGRVEDLIVNMDKGIVDGLVIESKGLLKNGKYISLNDVVSIGRDAVIVTDEEVINEDNQNLVEKHSWQNHLGKNIMTADGTDIGTIQDIFIELPEGRILGIELSGGIWADLNQGRKMLAWESVVLKRLENLVVDNNQKHIWH